MKLRYRNDPDKGKRVFLHIKNLCCEKINRAIITKELQFDEVLAQLKIVNPSGSSQSYIDFCPFCGEKIEYEEA